MRNKLILFVHGLGGNPIKTWGIFPDLLNSDNDINSDYEIDHFDYPTSLFRFPFGPILPKIQDIADGLKSKINNNYANYEEIMLVCHSLGGLIGKKYVLEEIKSNNRLRISKILLFATPNNGAMLASIGSFLTWSHYQIHQLKKKSDFVELLNEDWYKYNIDGKVIVKYVIAAQDKIVDKFSAKNIWGNKNYEVILNKKHKNIAKPIDKNDLTYIYLKNFVLAKSKKDEEYDNFVKSCHTFTKSQIDSQKKIKKYIPDVFTEITNIKEIARYYADPILFMKKVFEELGSINFLRLNEFLSKYSLDLINYSFNKSSTSEFQLDKLNQILEEVKAFIDNKINWIDDFQKEIRTIKLGEGFSDVQKYWFDWEKYEYESLYKYKWKLEDIKERLIAFETQVLIVTSAAGHGKTNFICDFVENVLFKREIPCLLFFGKDFFETDLTNLENVIIQKLGYLSSCSDIHTVLDSIGSNFEKNKKCLVIMIDGLNEQKNYALFSGRLNELVKKLRKFYFVKFIFTCRSEYFKVRFNDFLTSDIGESILLKEDFDSRIRSKDRNRLFEAYSKFYRYKIQNISDSIWRKLTDDPLFLRVFSEAYGDANSPHEIIITDLTHLYKNKIFDLYLNKKKTELSTKIPSDSLLKSYSTYIFENVLFAIIERMLDSGMFMNLSKSKLNFSKEQFDELDRMIDEDILIQENLDASKGNDECINFTFDEFRDYLLAKIILKKNPDVKTFEAIILELTSSKSMVSEGLARYLFYTHKESANEKLSLIIENFEWYERIFCNEIFAIDDHLVNNSDIRYLTTLFKLNQQYSRMFVEKLIYRRDTKNYQRLNVSCLLDIISELEDSEYNKLITPIFILEIGDHHQPYRRGGFELKFLFDFLLKTITSKNDKNIKDYLCYLELIFLLIDDTTEVWFEAKDVFEEFASKYPEEASAIILKYLMCVKSLSLFNNVCDYIIDLVSYGVTFNQNFYNSIGISLDMIVSAGNEPKIRIFAIFLHTLIDLNKLQLDESKMNIIESFIKR